MKSNLLVNGNQIIPFPMLSFPENEVKESVELTQKCNQLRKIYEALNELHQYSFYESNNFPNLKNLKKLLIDYERLLDVTNQMQKINEILLKKVNLQIG